MHRWWAATVILSGLVSAPILAAPPADASSGISVKVTPNRGLVNGQSVTISGRGLARSAGGKPLTWFVTECTAAVQGRMNPSTDTPHCDVTDAHALQVRRNGTFSAHFHVTAGIIGDGYCGTPGHPMCVIGVGNADGQGTVVKITFKAPAGTTTTTTTTTTTPAG
jgi:hypothetical protein